MFTVFVSNKFLIKINEMPLLILLFHDGDRYHIETSPLICRANQLTGLYMIMAPVMKELNMPLPKSRRVLLGMETEPFCSERLSNDNILSLHITLMCLSFSLFILLLFVWVWHIYLAGQYFNCDVKDAFIKIIWFEVFMYGAILAKVAHYPSG